MTKKTRRKIDAALKAKIALKAGRSRRRWSIWPSAMRFTRTRSMPGRSNCWNKRPALDVGVGRESEATREREIEKLHAKIGQLTVSAIF
jgi:transposase